MTYNGLLDERLIIFLFVLFLSTNDRRTKRHKSVHIEIQVYIIAVYGVYITKSKRLVWLVLAARISLEQRASTMTLVLQHHMSVLNYTSDQQKYLQYTICLSRIGVDAVEMGYPTLI